MPNAPPLGPGRVSQPTLTDLLAAVGAAVGTQGAVLVEATADSPISVKVTATWQGRSLPPRYCPVADTPWATALRGGRFGFGNGDPDSLAWLGIGGVRSLLTARLAGSSARPAAIGVFDCGELTDVPHAQRTLALAVLATDGVRQAAAVDAAATAQAIVEHAHELICAHDLEGRLAFVNPAVWRALGYQQAADLVGRPLAAFVPPRYKAEVSAYLDEVVRTGRAAGHLVLETRSGGEMIVEYRNVVHRPPSGPPLVLGVARDVSERMASDRLRRDLKTVLEAQLQERTDDYRAAQLLFERLASTVPVGTFQTDALGRTVFVNAQYKELTGLSSLSNETEWLKAIHPDDRARVWEEWLSAQQAGRASRAEYRLRSVDGRVRWVSGFATPIFGAAGDVTGFVGAIADVTAVRQTSDALRTSEARLAEAQRLARLGTWEWRADQGTFWCSDTMCELLGVAPGSLTGSIDAFLSLVHGEDRERIRQAIADAQAGRRVEADLRVAMPDGVEQHFHLRLAPIAPGDAAGVRATAQDITERIRVERELRRREALLLQSQKMEALGLMAGGVAHDFNNLLTVIRGYTELLMQSTDAEGTTAPILREVLSAAEQATNLTTQLLTFSRKQIVATRTLDLNQAVQSAERMVSRMLPAHVELVTTYAPGRLWVRAGPGQIEQLVVNLAINARDAMDAGGTLRIETTAALAVAGESEAVAFIVADTGAGMDESTQAHAFEPFFTTKPVGQGTGLGLSIVYGLVQQLGGRIDLSSQPGAGTRFIISLPVAASPDAATHASPSSTALSPAPLRHSIVVVEDDSAVRSLIAATLARHGAHVVAFGSGRDALDSLRDPTLACDLLVTDILMPELDGPELARRVRTIRPTVKVLYLSGYSGDTDLSAELARGAKYLRKPFAADDLRRAIRDLLFPPDGGPA